MGNLSKKVLIEVPYRNDSEILKHFNVAKELRDNLSPIEIAKKQFYESGIEFSEDWTILQKYNKDLYDKEYTIPSCVTHIGEYAFYKCYDLNSVTIPNSVTSIGKEAFALCERLQNIYVGKNFNKNIIPKEYRKYVKVVHGSNDVTPPKQVTIATHRSIRQTQTKKAKLQQSTPTIALYRKSDGSVIRTKNSTKLSTTPQNQTTSNSIMQKNATTNHRTTFSNPKPPRRNYRLEQIEIAKKQAAKDDVEFSNNWSVLERYYNSTATEYTIPGCVTRIGVAAFCYCSNLRSVTIPKSVSNIEAEAFSNCSNLRNVTIQSSVINIGRNAFSGCSKLSSVTIQTSLVTIEHGAFSGCSSLQSIYVNKNVNKNIIPQEYRKYIKVR